MAVVRGEKTEEKEKWQWQCKRSDNGRVRGGVIGE